MPLFRQSNRNAPFLKGRRIKKHWYNMKMILDTRESNFWSQWWLQCHIWLLWHFITTCDGCYYKMWELFYYKTRQKFIRKCIRFFITKCDGFITYCDSYYKMRQYDYKTTVIIKRVVCYKMHRYIWRHFKQCLFFQKLYSKIR